MKMLSDNEDLYQYLVALSAQLKQSKHESINKLILHACRAAASGGTVFLGETRIALRQILKENNDSLSNQQCADMQDVLKQIDAVLDKKQ